MGKEKEAIYYDDIFRASESYRMNFDRLDRFLIFVRIRQWMWEHEKYPVLEIGCGTGQLASYLETEGITNYTGIDFSKEALVIARGLSKQSFIRHDIRTGLQEIIRNTTVCEGQNIIFIATAVLEHIEEDIKLLEELPEKSTLLFSVPKFDDTGHVRYFHNQGEVKERYGNRLNFESSTLVDKSLIFLTTIKKRKPKNVVYE